VSLGLAGLVGDRRALREGGGHPGEGPGAALGLDSRQAPEEHTK
jgi:hypothetical protein